MRFKASTLAFGLLALTSIGMAATPAVPAETDGGVRLFKFVTVRDDIVVGVTSAQLQQLDSRDAPDLARALKERGTMGVWRYAVAKGPGGDLVNAPLARVGVLAHDTLRIEPYATSLPIAPPSEPAE